MFFEKPMMHLSHIPVKYRRCCVVLTGAFVFSWGMVFCFAEDLDSAIPQGLLFNTEARAVS